MIIYRVTDVRKFEKRVRRVAVGLTKKEGLLYGKVEIDSRLYGSLYVNGYFKPNHFEEEFGFIFTYERNDSESLFSFV